MYKEPGTRLRSIPLSAELDKKTKELAMIYGISQTKMLISLIEESTKRAYAAMNDARLNNEHYEEDPDLVEHYAQWFGEDELSHD